MLAGSARLFKRLAEATIPPPSRSCLLMPIARFAFALPALVLAAPLASASVQLDPLRFFEGRTVTEGTVKVMFHRPYETHSIGEGRIERDGSLTLVQRVQDEGKPAHERRWHVREVSPDLFSASMTEAVGPVTIDRVGDRYRFRFKLKGNLSAEQMLIPLPGGKAARNTLKVKRMGITVATTDGTIRKV
jgi:hypothetical protein